MSTRAQITVKGSGIYIYKHSDGYPEGVLLLLETVCREFREQRGNDPDYLLAQIIRRFAIDDERAYRERLATDPEMAKYYDPTRPTGWGVEKGREPNVLHGDIEYLYRVDPKTCVVTIEDPNGYRGE